LLKSSCSARSVGGFSSDSCFPPEHDRDRRFYRATAGLDLSVALGEPKATEESLIRLVAGARFPPSAGSGKSESPVLHEKERGLPDYWPTPYQVQDPRGTRPRE